MSGFFGVFRSDGSPVDEGLLDRVAGRLSTRGPDGTSVWKRGNLGGCFALMRTGPGPQAAEQPVGLMQRFWLWGDIRLDARRELQQQLEMEEPDSSSTSEHLLLQAWRKWGSAALDHILGDFSFALWDATENTFWCARDFVGARPFYYANVAGVFCFSNTLRILRQVKEVCGALDEVFIGDFLTEGWNADPERTVYRDIRRLPAGYLLQLSGGALSVRRFRKLPIEEPLRWKRSDEYLQHFQELLTTTVSDRLPHGRVSLYLSGGLDSAMVCATAAQVATGRKQQQFLKAFTVSWNPFFADPEPALAQLTARHLGIDHEVLQEEKLELFESAHNSELPPEPHNEVFFARERRFSQRIAAHAPVVLSGDGGDDVLLGEAWPYLSYLWRERRWSDMARDFGGYFWTHRKIPPLRAGIRSRIGRLLRRADPREAYPAWLNEQFAEKAKLKQRWLELKNRPKNTEHPVHPRAYRALHDGFWATVLEAEDAGWEGVLLETRAALLDLRILRFLLRLPPVPWCADKELIRRVMTNALPIEVLSRPKTPLIEEPLSYCRVDNCFGCIEGEVRDTLESFVNLSKWCETFGHSKGSLNPAILRPASLFHWLNAVENR